MSDLASLITVASKALAFFPSQRAAPAKLPEKEAAARTVRRVYCNLDLRIDERKGQLLVEVQPGCDIVGTPEDSTAIPVCPKDVGSPGSLRRHFSPQPQGVASPSPKMPDWAASVGAALLPGKVGNAFKAAKLALKLEQGIRIRIVTREDQLARIPWEAALVEGKYLSLGPATPIVRYVRSDAPPPSLRVNGRLRILGVVSNANVPGGQLDVAAEKKKLADILSRLPRNQAPTVDWIRGDTNELQEAIQHEYHILHYIGHSRYDAAAGQGRLLFESPGGGAVEVPCDFLVGVLLRESTIRFALLNSCESGQPTGGLARAFVEGGMAAAVGMHSNVLDDVAIRFAAGFYAALVKHLPVDVAVVEGRKAIVNVPPYDQHCPDWVEPVLYMRCRDGVLFEAPDGLAG